MELKGIITQGESKWLTCCQSVTDILIGGVSLYDKLEELFNQDSEGYFEDGNKQSPRYGVRYVILEEQPIEDKTFEQQSAEVVTQMLYADYVSGCYSEWTCGYGGFDYAIDNGGHSIFKELESYVGKYVHFAI
jgi:hypothetical protein